MLARLLFAPEGIVYPASRLATKKVAPQQATVSPAETASEVVNSRALRDGCRIAYALNKFGAGGQSLDRRRDECHWTLD
jgi:hypothetical protein